MSEIILWVSVGGWSVQREWLRSVYRNLNILSSGVESCLPLGRGVKSKVSCKNVEKRLLLNNGPIFMNNTNYDKQTKLCRRTRS